MRTASRTLAASRSSRRGTILVAAVFTVLVVFGLCVGFLQLSLATTRKQDHSVDSRQAFYLAEAGLAEAYTGLAVAKTGNVGTPALPAAIGDGLFWVEADELGGDLVQLESTALYGRGRVTLGLVVRRQQQSLATLGIFTSDDVDVTLDSLIDSYDSRQGTYQDQVTAGVNLDHAILGTNGNATLRTGVTLKGDLVHGPLGTATLIGTSSVTGSVQARPGAVPLPPVELPTIPLSPPFTADDVSAPFVLPPGEHGLQSLTIAAGAQTILTGPATIVLGELTAQASSELVFDTRNGPIDLYVADSVDLVAASVASMSKDDPTLVTVQIAGNGISRLDAQSQFYGFIYAPLAEVRVSADFEVFGGLVADNLQLADRSKLHMDVSLGMRREDVLPTMWSWRVVDVPDAVASKGADPFLLLGVDPALLPLPAEAHQDQWLALTYEDGAGIQQTYAGQESGFDWTQVALVVEGSRDGSGFQSVPGSEPSTAPTEPEPPPLTPEEQILVDLIDSAATSTDVMNELLGQPTVSEAVMIAAINRTPAMDSWDLYMVMEKQGPYSPSYPNGTGSVPLADDVLRAAIAQPDFDSKQLGWALKQNSPLPPDVLQAAIDRNPAMKTPDLNKVLQAQ